MKQLQELIRVLKYTRWDYEAERRETYPETIQRAMADYKILARGLLSESEIASIEKAMLNKTAFGSMRMLAMAGPAFNYSNLVGYNCAALPIDRFDSLHDLMILGMSGVGVTYSVEEMHISKMPIVKLYNGIVLQHKVADTTEGWASALDFVIRMTFDGFDVQVDYSKVRGPGIPLKKKGGRSSGPDPLEKSLNAIINIIVLAKGRKLNSLEWSDICCWTGDATVQGGVRRTALMAVFNKGDELMLHAKDDMFFQDADGKWKSDPDKIVRRNANFSQIFLGNETREEFYAAMDIMLDGNGEPAFFNRHVAFLRLGYEYTMRLPGFNYILPNPCGETVLIWFGLCNLSVLIARANSTLSELLEAADVAALLAVLQANATYFPSLRVPEWRNNAELLRQCGVSITGFADSSIVREVKTMRTLYKRVVETATRWADKLGINKPATFTSVKPAGTTSYFADSSPGVNPRHFKYALRRVTLKKNDPLVTVLKQSGVPLEDSVYNDNEIFAVFPLKAPDGALTLEDMTAIDQMELYLSVLENWSDQAVSVTVNFEDGEQDAIKDWLWAHREKVTSMTFLKNDGKQFPQMMIEEIDKTRYNELANTFPEIQWELLQGLEQEDYTEGSNEVGCSGGTCALM